MRQSYVIDICQLHSCSCGGLVDGRGVHALSWKRSIGRLARHHNINDIVYCVLSKTHIPCVKEPSGLIRSDGKRPDGLYLIPWHQGKCVTWYMFVINPLASSYVNSTGFVLGGVAEFAALPSSNHSFCKLFAQLTRPALRSSRTWVVGYRSPPASLGKSNSCFSASPLQLNGLAKLRTRAVFISMMWTTTTTSHFIVLFLNWAFNPRVYSTPNNNIITIALSCYRIMCSIHFYCYCCANIIAKISVSRGCNAFSRPNRPIKIVSITLSRSVYCRETFTVPSGATRLLIIQCDSGDVHADLIACARYNVTNEYSQSPFNIEDINAAGDVQPAVVHVLFIIHLPRIAGGCFVGFQVRFLHVISAFH